LLLAQIWSAVADAQQAALSWTQYWTQTQKYAAIQAEIERDDETRKSLKIRTKQYTTTRDALGKLGLIGGLPETSIHSPVRKNHRSDL
jgi:hypothetical protein